MMMAVIDLTLDFSVDSKPNKLSTRWLSRVIMAVMGCNILATTFIIGTSYITDLR
jgi:hypothetical protein